MDRAKLIMILAAIFIFIQTPAQAEESADVSAKEKSSWKFTVGAKGVYSSGISDTNTYYRPFGGAGYDFDFLKASIEISRYINYQTTDGQGSYKYISYNEAGLIMDLVPADWFDLNLEGRHSKGDDNYSGSAYSAEILLDFDVVAVTADGSRTIYQYDFDDINLKLQNNDYSASFEFYPSESASLDAGVSYSIMIFEDDYEYSKFTARLGTMIETAGTLFIMAGLGAGRDSEDYTIYGFDAGFNWKIFDYIKVLALYSFQYYQAPGSDAKGRAASTKAGGSGPDIYGDSGGIDNPFLRSSKVGESYYSHIASLSVSRVF